MPMCIHTCRSQRVSSFRLHSVVIREVGGQEATVEIVQGDFWCGDCLGLIQAMAKSRYPVLFLVHPVGPLNPGI